MKRWIIGVFAVAVVTGAISRNLGAVTAAYNSTVRIVSRAGTVLDGGVASATSASYNSTVRVVNSSGLVLDSFGAPGLTTLTGAPMWARYFGDCPSGPLCEGAVTSGTENLTGEHYYTTFDCNGTITANDQVGVVIRASTSITLEAGCAFNFNGTGSQGGNTSAGYLGGAGGGSGGGAAAGAAGYQTCFMGQNVFNATNACGGAGANHSYTSGAGAAGASSGGDGGNATQIVSAQFPVLLELAGASMNANRAGGGSGSAGGSSGGANGHGGMVVILDAPTITIASGATIDVSGGPGIGSAANSTGAGGGGGGGFIGLFGETITDNGGLYYMGGGQGGRVTAPYIVLKNGAGDSTGAGGIITLTGLTTGGLDASKATITAGTNYTTAPSCSVVANGSGITGTPTCHVTISGGGIATFVVDTAGSGGTFTAFTTAGKGGYGGNGWMSKTVIQ